MVGGEARAGPVLRGGRGRRGRLQRRDDRVGRLGRGPGNGRGRAVLASASWTRCSTWRRPGIARAHRDPARGARRLTPAHAAPSAHRHRDPQRPQDAGDRTICADWPVAWLTDPTTTTDWPEVEETARPTWTTRCSRPGRSRPRSGSRRWPTTQGSRSMRWGAAGAALGAVRRGGRDRRPEPPGADPGRRRRPGAGRTARYRCVAAARVAGRAGGLGRRGCEGR